MNTKEIHIDRLVKLVLSEERKKRNILPETWERAPAGKPKDPIGYWKALYDNLKKNGFPVQYQYANDPAKSTFMWWGSWIIWKDLKKNNGYPISFTTPNKNVYLFKFKDGIYRGTLDLSKLILVSECINYTYPMNLSMFKKSQKEVAAELSKDFKTKPKSVFGCMMKITNYQYDEPKSSGTPTKSKNYPYDELKNNPTPEFIAKILKESRGSVNDNEAWAEAAFMAIKNMDMYNKVANALKTDPYKFVRSFIEVSVKYHVQAIQVSYLNLLDNNVGTKVTKFSTQCKLTFTEQNPGGGKTNKAGQVPYSLWNTNKDPYLKVVGAFGEYKGVVPEDFGWKLNNNIYPYPTLYSKECTTTTKINESEVFSKNKDGSKKEFFDPTKLTNKDFQKMSNKTNQKKMIEFNNALVQQKKLIPQYCTFPARREKRIARGGNDPKIVDAYLSMYTLCKDFGGLWVRGANTANFTCGCRDMDAIDLNIAIDDGSGFQNRMGQTVSQSINKTQTSKNWSDKNNQQLALNVVALASAFIPVVGPAISAGISLAGAYSQYRQGNNKAAAIELFFAVLPFIGKIPGMAKVSRAMAGSLKVKLVRGGKLTLQEYNAIKNIIAYDTYVSTKVGQYLEKQAMSDVSKNLLTTAVKKTEQKIVALSGLPTYGDIKKKAAGETLTVTTGLENTKEG
jgi:hypothetical protein